MRSSNDLMQIVEARNKGPMVMWNEKNGNFKIFTDLVN